jgi:hypothetical protein
MYQVLIDRFKDSIIVISHKLGSLVSADTIERLLVRQRKKIFLYEIPYTYALNKSNGKSQQNVECLIIGV